MIKPKIGPLALAVMVSVISAPLASAQIEEIVVTARKKRENLQDVPIAVQAVSGGYIADTGLVDVQALAPYTPNFSYATAIGANDILLMRGVGSIGPGVQFESSVGQVFDGYFISRSRLGRSAFLDLGQVEVLKGPQGAIIGKNTSLGAINMTPNKPTDEFEASVSAGHGWQDFEGPEASAIISGPLTDNVRARLALEYKDQDGYVENTSPNASYDNAYGNETLAGRLIIQADLSDTMRAELLYQTSDTTREGKPLDIIWCPPDGIGNTFGGDMTRSALEARGVNCDRDGTTASVAYEWDPVAGALNPNSVLEDALDIETNVYGLRFDKDVGDFTLTSLTGYADYEISDVFDADQTNDIAVSVQQRGLEEYSQFTQEFRIAADLENSSYIAGVFYLDNEMQNDQVTIFPTPPLNGERNRLMNIDTTSLNLFGQGEWLVTDNYRFTIGLRWTDEEREGRNLHYPTMPYSDIPWGVCPGGGPLVCTDPTAIGPTGVARPVAAEISESDFSGNVSLQRDLENGMVYAAFSVGTKSGSFAVGSALFSEDLMFGGEETNQLELGGKHQLLDNTLRFNWAIFHMDIDGLQISAINPELQAPTSVPVNADVISNGAEIDLTWLATDALTLSWVAGFTDATFDGFKGDCWSGQDLIGSGCINGKQDLDGKQLPLAPEMSSVLGADYKWFLAGDMTLEASIKWLYSSDMGTQVDLHPQSGQDAFSKFDASLMLINGNWRLGLVGRNLSDKRTYQFTSTPPGVGGNPAPNPVRTINGFPEPGRTIALKFTYNWY
jgi:iron complex outermembrane receptor protein